MTEWTDRFTDWQDRYREAHDAGDGGAVEALRIEAAALARDLPDTTGEAWAKAADEASAADTPEAARAVFKAAAKAKAIPEPVEPPRRALPAARIQGQPADRVLWMAGQSGAILRAGSVAMLAGEGGIAKSALAGCLAVGVAALQSGEPGTAVAGLFEAVGGPALIVAFEDEAAEVADRLRGLVHSPGYAADQAEADRILGRAHVLDLAGKPVFGPAESGGRVGFYNQRPGRLSGWDDLWAAAREVRPRLIVIDPALAAYVGEPNGAAPVREFLAAVSKEARAIGAGVLIVAHSRKDVRGQRSEADDPFDAGHVAGSGAWHDGARAVMTQTWDNARGQGFRRLALAKANYGPAKMVATMDAVRAGGGAIVGFTAAGGWSEHVPAEPSAGRGKGQAKKAKGYA